MSDLQKPTPVKIPKLKVRRPVRARTTLTLLARIEARNKKAKAKKKK